MEDVPVAIVGRVGRQRPRVVEILQEVGLLVGAQHEVHAVHLAHLLRVELGVAPRHHHESARVLPDQAMYCLAALMVGHLRNRTGIDEADVSLLAIFRLHDTHLAEELGESGGL